MFKPIRLEMQRLRTPTPVERRFNVRISQKVRRSLFGPVDHDETRRMLEAELERHRINESRKWNFDFDREIPLDAKGRYEWCPLTPTKEHCKRPEKRLAVVREDICHLYAQPTEEILRSKEESMSVSPVIEKLAACKTQTVITGMFIFKLNMSVRVYKGHICSFIFIVNVNFLLHLTHFLEV